MLQIVIEIIILLSATVAGFYTIRYMTPFFRIIYVQLLVWIIFYSTSHLLTHYQELHGLPKNNQWLMNIHMIMETILLVMAAFTAFQQLWRKWLALCGLILFFAIAIIQAIVYGTTKYLHYADVSECILVTILYALLLHSFSRKLTGSWWSSPGIIICIGQLIYFACSVPYVTMMHYLQEKDPELNHFLFDIISNVLASARYAFYLIAFLAIRRKPILKSPI